MAKATTSKTESLTIRVPFAELAAWKADAGAGEISVAALIRRRMESGPAVTKAKLDELEADIARLAASLARVTELEAEAVTLKQTIQAQAKKIAALENGIAQGLGRSSGPLPSAAGKSGVRPKVGRMLLGNPVMSETVPKVDGDVEWCGLKGSRR